MSRFIIIEANPVPIKAALARAGHLASEEVRSPLCPLLDANRKTLFGVLDALSAKK